MLTNTFYRKKNYKLMWHNIIGYEINSNFEKLNHVVPHQFVKVFIYFILWNVFVSLNIFL